MIAGEYSAAQAYKAFDSQLRESGDDSEETVKAFVEGCEGGFTPFNRGSLPVVSGIAMEVQEDHGTYTLTKVTRDGEAAVSYTHLDVYKRQGTSYPTCPFHSDSPLISPIPNHTVQSECSESLDQSTHQLA